MAKLRFTDCDIWESLWYMELSTEHKLFWRYLCDRCDNAGVWSVNSILAQAHLGFPIELDSALAALEEEVSPFASGKKWLLKNFIRFQYPGGLKESVVPHRQVMRLLLSHGIHPEGVVGRVVDGPPSGPKDKDTDQTQTRHRQGQGEPERVAPKWDRPQFVKWLQRRGMETGVTPSGQDRTEEWIGLAEECGCVSFPEARACLEALMRIAKKQGVTEYRWRSKLDPFKAGYIEAKKLREQREREAEQDGDQENVA